LLHMAASLRAAKILASMLLQVLNLLTTLLYSYTGAD
jgi:hypothetical protein